MTEGPIYDIGVTVVHDDGSRYFIPSDAGKSLGLKEGCEHAHIDHNTLGCLDCGATRLERTQEMEAK